MKLILKEEPSASQLILYQTDDGKTKLQVRLDRETVWLSQNQMAELFQTTKQNVSLHIKNIFSEGELLEGAVVKDFLTTASDGKNYQTRYYNLDVIISVGYRVKSHRGTQFRIWATQCLREYIVKGFALDDDRLKLVGGGRYFDELLTRIQKPRRGGLQKLGATPQDKSQSWSLSANGAKWAEALINCLCHSLVPLWGVESRWVTISRGVAPC